VPLVRVPRQLPKILEPDEARALLAALRTQRDRAMVLAMLLADRSVFVAEGKGGHQRVVPVANPFFVALGDYVRDERPASLGTDRVFLALKGPRRGSPLSAEGVDEVIAGARRRARLEHGTCHQLRHTCLTRLREAGMALEAVQAQAGHRSIESTRVYLHLTNDWLAQEYRRAAELIEASHAAELIAMQETVQ
jgi:site-specific recombinase XerD